MPIIELSNGRQVDLLLLQKEKLLPSSFHYDGQVWRDPASLRDGILQPARPAEARRSAGG